MMPCFSTIAAANQPPPAPRISGPTSGKAGVLYHYGFCSKDPDGDNVTYCIDWGDGSDIVYIGPFPPNLCGTASHTWSRQGTYIIKAKASDGQAESNWSTLGVTMPLSYEPPHFRFLDWLLEWFPNAFPILRHLFK